MKTAFFSFVFAVACICAILLFGNKLAVVQTDNSVQYTQAAKLIPGPLLRANEAAFRFEADNAPVWLAAADDDDGFESCGACWARV